MKKKIIVLVVLAVIAAWTWLPKLNLLKSIGKEKAKPGYAGFFEPMPARKKNKKRTSYKDWGRILSRLLRPRSLLRLVREERGWEGLFMTPMMSAP